MDTKTAADKIRKQVDPGLDALLARDHRFVGAVCKELDLSDSPANRAQVLVALSAAGISAKIEYPKVKYHVGEKPADPAISRAVIDADDEKALGDGWYDTPEKAIGADVPKARTVKAKA